MTKVGISGIVLVAFIATMWYFKSTSGNSSFNALIPVGILLLWSFIRDIISYNKDKS
jgi:hypothetical protein